MKMYGKLIDKYYDEKELFVVEDDEELDED